MVVRRGRRHWRPPPTRNDRRLVPPDGFDQGDRVRIRRQRVLCRSTAARRGRRPRDSWRSLHAASSSRTREAPRRRCTRRSTSTAARSTRARTAAPSFTVDVQRRPRLPRQPGLVRQRALGRSDQRQHADRRRHRPLEEHQRRRVALSQISDWSLAPASAHADHHVIVEQPGFNGTRRTRPCGSPTTAASTGPRTSTRSAAASRTAGWSAFNNNLGITQFYGAAGGTATGVILGGTQDNGTLKYTPATGTTWVTEFGGDGGASAVDPIEQQQPVRRIHLRLGPSQHRRRRQRRLDQRPVLERHRCSYCKPAPYTIVGHLQRVAGELHRAVHPRSQRFEPAARRRRVALADQRRDDAEHRHHGAVVERASRRRPALEQLHQRHCRRPGQFQRRSGSGTTTGSCTRRRPARRARPPGRASGAGTLPAARFVTRVRVDPTDANTVYVTYGGFSTNNVWKTTNGGDVVGVRVRHRRHRHCRPFRFATSPSTRRTLPGCTPRPKSACSRARTAARRGRCLDDGPANVSVEELFWMGTSLVAVTHGRGLFMATPDTEPETPVITWPTPAPITVGTALERDAVERDDHRARHLRLHAWRWDVAWRRDGSDPVDDLHADRYLQLHDRHGQRVDRRREGDADDHLVDAGRHRLRDSVEWDAAECDQSGARHVDLQAGRRHGPLGR